MKEKNNKKGEYRDDLIVTDPFGSYTGRSENRNDTPVQDADDL